MDEEIKKEIAIIKEWAKITLIGNEFESPIGLILVTMTGIKETINQPHKFRNEKINAIYFIPDLLAKSVYIESADDEKGNIKKYHYLQIVLNNEYSYIVIKETWQGQKNFYSIVDGLKGK
jgi:hypothetical protein